jgi:hypothetical protein
VRCEGGYRRRMTPTRDWTEETERRLRAAGWHPERRETAKVEAWRIALESPEGFCMSAAARAALEELGGLRAAARGPGLECARGSFVLDPELAWGEEDRFGGFSRPLAGGMFPLGEVDGGHAFLGIDEAGVVYTVGDGISRLGDSVYAALDSILQGRQPTLVERWYTDG